MSAELDAFGQLEELNILQPGVLFSPSKARRGYYTKLLRQHQQSQPLSTQYHQQTGHDPAATSIRAAAATALVRQPRSSDPLQHRAPVSSATLQLVANGTAALSNAQIRRPSTAEKVQALDTFAGELLADPSIRVADRLIHLRHKASELELNLRDDDLRRKVWEARRRRSGAVEMFTPGMVQTLDQQTWAWDGLLMAHDTNLIAALPKVGKTTLLIDAIGRWHRGEPEHLGQPFHGPCPPVIIAGTDMPRGLWLKMLGRFGLATQRDANSWQLPADGPIKGLFSTDSPIHLDDEGIARLVEVVTPHPGCLLIVDSYARCCSPLGLKEASSDYAGPLGDLQEALAPFNATLAVIHHSGHSRAGEGAVAACRGTSALPAAASHIIALSWLNKAKGSNDKRVVVQTEGRGGEPLQLLIEQHDAGWQSHGDAAEAFKEQQLAEEEDNLHDRQADALEAVRERWEQHQQRTSTSDLIAALGLRGANAPRIARRTLQQLTKRGLLDSSKEATANGQVVWFWPVGQQDRGHPPVPSIPPILPVLPVPSPPSPNTPKNPQTPNEIREGTLKTEKIGRMDNGERGHPLSPPLSSLTPPDELTPGTAIDYLHQALGWQSGFTIAQPPDRDGLLKVRSPNGSLFFTRRRSIRLAS